MTIAAEHQERLQRAVGDRYRVEGAIGEGGMATVFLAEDVKHHRKVAIKVLHETLAHTIGIRRFLQEIEVIAGLQHPHLLTLIDSGEVDGLPYYVMPYLEAQSLRELIAREKRLPIDRAVAIASEIADGLQFAHERGVIHRDIKPSNVLMSGAHAVIADFGIATALNKAAVGRITETGISLGSPTYMSPEQASAERDLDARSDIYSLGCIVYEMLCGEPPIDGPSMQQTVTRKLTGSFAPLRTLRPDVPAALEAAVQKALATNREERFATAQSFGDALANALSAERARPSRKLIVMRVIMGVAAVVVFAVLFQHQRRVLWASQRLGEIDRLAKNGEFATAFELDTKVGAILRGDSTLRRLRPAYSDFIHVVTTPANAKVYRKRLDKPDDKWQLLGTTPLDSIPMPKYGRDAGYALRIERDGFKTVELLPNVFANWAAWRGVAPLDTLRLDPAGTLEGMVRIPGWRALDTLHRTPGRVDSITFADYHIGRYEVSNREFKQFIASGGYDRREYWREPFVRNGDTLSWEDAMRVFRDRSGLPGPSTWSNGTFPEGQADYPVGGVSFYEAAAYARFAGKSLPTSTHWFRGALRHDREAGWLYGSVSNLNGNGPRPVGQGHMNSYGMYDIQGNVREWCLNPIDSGRLTRGASWEDDHFFVGHLIPKPEFDRAPTNGFRLVALSDADTTVAHLSGRIVRVPPRDFSKVTPVADAEFKVFSRLFLYDRLPLNARVDTSGVSEQWRWERVSFTAAYGGERMAAYLFLPRAAKPPYQPVIFWPGANAMTERRFDARTWSLENMLGFLPRSGRAIVMPVFKGAYDRDDSTFSTRNSGPDSTVFFRDLAIQWTKDMRRTIDYLETRPDMAADAVGYFGVSWGGQTAPMALAMEPRIRAAVLYVGGLPPGGSKPLPEVEAVNYLPRVRTPTLMLNGRYDVVFPHASSQLPFFQLLGTPMADKKHITYESSHSVPQQEMVRETLAWFDKYLVGKPTP